jgi:probable phosphoglycerate mutase
VIDSNPPIYFIRHGETDWNRERRIQGQTDIPLNGTGHGQSGRVARCLKDFLGHTRIEHFIVSPLIRARQTMSYVSREFGVMESRVTVAPAVTELGFGVWEGRRLHELNSHPEFPADPGSRFSWRPQYGESYADGCERLKQWIGRLDAPSIIVAHGAIGRCLIGLVSNLSPDQLLMVKTPQGCFCRLQNGRIDWFDVNGDAA